MLSRGRTWILLLPLAGVLTLFLFWPLTLVVRESLFSEGRFSLSNYTAMFVSKLYRESLTTSLALSVSTTLLGVLIGLPLSYGMHRSGPGMRNAIMTLATIPLTFSGLVVGFAFIVLLGTSGFVTLLLKKFFDVNPLEFSAFLFTWRGLVAAYCYFLIPRMILTMTAAWSTADWSLLEAARSLGAGPVRILAQVLLPMIGPAVLAGSSLLFAVSMGAFGTAFSLTGIGVKILPLVIYTHVSELSTEIAKADALAVLLTVITTLIILGYERCFVRRPPSSQG
jgi:putative spermidine/putrescine transport system permease protein